ncbi:MAG TPA: putative LPS assembly protein LptD [Vicinamibacterales bacterium]|nr:putative LPS assembly protein LptD [Vicinamibacterales bacterium]
MLRTSLLVLLALAAGVLPARAQGGAPSHGCSAKWSVVSDVANNFANQNHYILLRNVQVECNDVQLFADEAEVFRDADRVRASGNVVFVSGTSRISAERMEFNTRTKTGTFFVASGIANLENRGIERSLFGTQEPDAYFWGDTIEKLGPKTYRITRGGFTTCVQPTPRWEMVAGTVTLTLEKRAVLTNMVLKVKDVPVFYLPAMYYPINKEDRATGFLIPIYGNSDIKGQTLNNAFFWAISRSQDATLYHSFYSKTGQSFGGEYRYVQSGASNGNFQTTVVREHEATYRQASGTNQTFPGIDSYSVTGTVLQALPANLRLTGTANYFSSLIAQQRYQQDIFAATNRTRNFGVNVAGNWGANSVSGTVDRNETFTNDTNSTVTGSLPRINYTRSEKRIAALPLYVGAASEYVELVRTGRTPTGETPLGLRRLDLVPRVRFPFTKLQYLTFNSSLTFHQTFWSESLDESRKRVPEGIQRRYFDLTSSITGPVFTKIFNTPGRSYAQKWKHVIEPNLTISRKTAIANYDRIEKLEGTDFVRGGTTNYTYSLANRLYAKKESAREILNVGIQQTYYTDDRAAQVDFNYLSTQGLLPPSNFSPIALQVRVSPTTVTDATIRSEYDTNTSSLRAISANGGVVAGWALVNAGWSVNKSVPTRVDEDPVTLSHYLNATTVIRKPGNAFGGSYAFNFDMRTKAFLNQSIVAHYNTQCCGIAVEYQKFNFGTRAGQVGVPRDHRFNLSFTLAGIGTFSDLFGAFGGKQGR